MDGDMPSKYHVCNYEIIIFSKNLPIQEYISRICNSDQMKNIDDSTARCTCEQVFRGRTMKNPKLGPHKA